MTPAVDLDACAKGHVGRVHLVHARHGDRVFTLDGELDVGLAAERTLRQCDTSPSANFDRTRILTTLDYRFSPR